VVERHEQPLRGRTSPFRDDGGKSAIGALQPMADDAAYG
jgi:hypothetical protein